METIDLTELRVRLGNISQEELGRRLGGISQSAVSRLEMGLTRQRGLIAVTLRQLWESTKRKAKAA